VSRALVRAGYFFAPQGRCAGAGAALRFCQRPFSGLHAHGRILVIATARQRRNAMAWTTPTLVEICVGLEINGYLPAEF
jgi:coenzyme PQQ precursor peptide PqqA